MLKIRLRRTGAKFQPHYRVVVADARAPRDGRFVTILGHYDPRTDPPTVSLDGAKLEEWVKKGAQPTEAVIGLLRLTKLAPGVVEAYGRKNKASSANAPMWGERAEAAPAAEAVEAVPTGDAEAEAKAAPAARAKSRPIKAPTAGDGSVEPAKAAPVGKVKAEATEAVLDGETLAEAEAAEAAPTPDAEVPEA